MLTKKPINPSIEANIDFAVSLTGRQTNDLYDVRYVDLGIVADTTKIPDIINALAKQNFITVLNAIVEPVDPYDHVAQGYLYGSGTLSEVWFTLETIWLREWTKDMMPDALRAALGIAADPPAGNG